MADPIRRRVPYVNLQAQVEEERDELFPLIQETLLRGDHVGGELIGRLEAELAAWMGVRHAVLVNSGTDALMFGLLAAGVGRGDDVITVPNSFIASTAAIVHVGASPVFVDVGPDQNMDIGKIAAAITPKTRAIMPVHLTGRVSDMAAILDIAKAHNLVVIEDAAQSIGSTYQNRLSGTFGDIGCFSLHPLKNLNAVGDGGILVTNRSDVAERVSRLRNHGMADRNTVIEFGFVSRLDTLQAAIVRFRLGRLGSVVERRIRNAALYRERLDRTFVFFPEPRGDAVDTYHTFVIQTDRRNELRAWLEACGVGTAIHYPIPIHLQPAAAKLGYRLGDFPEAERQAGRILTLPINQFLNPEDVAFVCDRVNGFFAGEAR